MKDYDTAEAGLIDVNGLSLSKLRDEIDGFCLESALRWIFAPQEESKHHGFSSVI